MKDRIMLITGATGGIGKQTALQLAKQGASVVITGRNASSGQSAVEEIKAAAGHERVGLLLADLTTIQGIRGLVQAFTTNYGHLDVLINNAGSAANTFQMTPDGLETNFAVNVIAPYLLCQLLKPALDQSGRARIVTLTGGNLPKQLDTENLQAEKKFDGLNTYAQTKMAMMCVMYELHLAWQHNPITCNVCYPGQASTSMTQNVTRDMLPWIARPLFPIFKYFTRPDNGESARKASRSSVFLATSPDVEQQSGLYVDQNVRIRTQPIVVQQEQIRRRVWDYVQQVVQEKAPDIV